MITIYYKLAFSMRGSNSIICLIIGIRSLMLSTAHIIIKMIIRKPILP